MKFSLSKAFRWLRIAGVLVFATAMAGCDPQVYGSIGISSGYSSYGGYGGPRLSGGVSVGGRIR